MRWDLWLKRVIANAIKYGPQPPPHIPNEQADELGEFRGNLFSNPRSVTNSWFAASFPTVESLSRIILTAKSTKLQVDELTIWSPDAPSRELGLWKGEAEIVPVGPAFGFPPGGNTSIFSAAFANGRPGWDRYGIVGGGSGSAQGVALQWTFEPDEYILNVGENLILYSALVNTTLDAVWALKYTA